MPFRRLLGNNEGVCPPKPQSYTSEGRVVIVPCFRAAFSVFVLRNPGHEPSRVEITLNRKHGPRVSCQWPCRLEMRDDTVRVVFKVISTRDTNRASG